MAEDALIDARARSLHDLEARRLADVTTVSLLEEALTQRRWWIEQWEEGREYVAGLVAQDVQDALFDRGVRWPRCTGCDETAEHSLSLEPELDASPRWICSESGIDIAGLGHLR